MRNYIRKNLQYEYMMVTADEYEDTIFTADSPAKLARIIGTIYPNYISRCVCMGTKYRWRGRWYKFIRVEVEEDNELIRDT